jgi:hypothetical protein
MTMHRSLAPALALLTAAATGFIVGKVTMTPAADAAAAHRFTLRVRDKVTIPSVGQVCAVYREGGEPELFCARARHSRHQVTFFADSILVWKAGNPDRPTWSGKP